MKTLRQDSGADLASRRRTEGGTYVPGQMPPEPAVYQFKVTLKGIKPPIWRRIQVPNDISLHHLHQVIQAAMGWHDNHLYQFDIGGAVFAEPDPGCGPPGGSAEGVALWEVLPGPKAKFLYEYDFGDGWRHEVVLEKVLPPAPEVSYPLCLAGARACPPEDCGGAWGYARLLEIIRNPEHKEYREAVAWLGRKFDPEAFDLEAVNRALEPLRGAARATRGTPSGARGTGERAALRRIPNRAALRRFCARNDVTMLGVFGSFARGVDRPDSDVDLLVRFSRPKSLLELVAMEEELAAVFGKKVDLLTEAALSPYLRDAILREMVVLYERTG